jgi:hypothetical protein
MLKFKIFNKNLMNKLRLIKKINYKNLKIMIKIQQSFNKNKKSNNFK